ncbi:tetratricopeptide repeat protein [Salibaculum halophilum]|uniref:tetratricopeptide repeat protein n=1 Tax=Salibaculum halophilum TaxID=1914408 RepID=UPI000A11B1B3|nr:tetratricopeptide repeat protein [Salibaculum halophilum]
MSDSDSFITEVTEEVRRDQLFQYLRRYGWIAVAVVLVLVGGTAFNEWRKAEARAEAQARGDAMLAAIRRDEPAARAEALTGLDPEGASVAVSNMLAAAELQQAGDTEGAVTALEAVATDEAVPAIYRDLAALKGAMVGAGVRDAETRRATLAGLSRPGAPFRMIAQEQLALIAVDEGETDAAVEQFRAIAVDAEATRGLRERALQMIVALGGEIEDLALPGGE